MKKTLRLTAIFVLITAGLNAQGVRPPRQQPPAFFWIGIQAGRLGEEMLYGEFSLSAQLGRSGYGSVYYLGGSVPLGSGDELNEYGFMIGPCSRTRGAFAGAAIGIGIMNGWIGPYSDVTAVGIPLKLEGAVIVGGFMALNLQIRAFVWKRTYSGISLGLQFGKLR